MQRSVSQDNQYTIEQMFEITNRNNQVFGIEGYSVVKKYEDPDAYMRARNYLTQKKGEKDKRYLTRRGSFMDPLDRIDRTKYPKPTHYEVIIKWPDANPKEEKKRYQTKRNTFIDEINNPKIVNAVPGVGKYNLELTSQQIKEDKDKLKSRKIKFGEKDNIFSDIEYLSNLTPGAGKYNPHDIIKKWKSQAQWDNPRDMIAKHQSQSNKHKKSKLPDIGTYNPISNDYNTFQKTFQVYGKVKITGKEPKSKKLGVDERFKDPKKSKVKKLIVPGPGNYNMISKWAGKQLESSKDPIKKDWQKLITKGMSKSIYY